jgi:monothiol glutaredoxin
MAANLAHPVHARIHQLVQANRVVLFMKGSPEMPQCGFSATAVGELEALGVDFGADDVATVDVLADWDVRNAIKEYSDWPTIPQLYVKQEFVGGSDIIKQMVATGELHGLLGVPFEAPRPPTLRATEAMQAAIAAAGAGPGEYARLVVGPGFRYQLAIDRQNPGDFLVDAGGVKILVDAGSARRADGISLDFRPGDGGGVIIDNPNEPAKVRPMDVRQLKQLLDGPTPPRLLDVRTPEERAIAMLHPSAELLTPELAAELEALPRSTALVFHCHHGGRSQRAAEHFVGRGFTQVHNLTGGIDAWSLFVDSGVPRY